MAIARFAQIIDFLFLFLAWLLGALGAYFLAGFFASSTPTLYHATILPMVITVLIAVPGYFALQAVSAYFQRQEFMKAWPALLALALVARFAYRVLEISFSFPNLIHADRFFLQEPWFVVYLVSVSLSLLVTWAIIFRLFADEKPRFASAKRLLEQVAPGLILAGMFFIIYFVLASVFNRQDFNTNNIFFAADTNSWQQRLADPAGHLMGMRSIHPLAFLVLRPIVSALSIFLNTDAFKAALLMVSLAGGLGIFLAWVFISRLVNGPNQATLFATLLGISTTSLLFNSLIETYVFSGFFLILFFVLLIKETRLPWLVLNGIALFGITISNIVQGLIGLFLTKFNFRTAFLFGLAVVLIAAGLNLAAQSLYPNSETFFNPAGLAEETQQYHAGTTPPEWLGRVGLVSSDMFLFSIVAPQPFWLDYNRDGGGGLFPKFNFMLGERSSEFIGLGNMAAWFWAGILVVAVITFIYSLRREKFSPTNRLALAFLGCLAFNFIFHFFYGFEPFLYAANWTYALILFAALGLSSQAYHKGVQVALLLLLALLSLNNLSFLHFLMSGLAPFIPTP